MYLACNHKPIYEKCQVLWPFYLDFLLFFEYSAKNPAKVAQMAERCTRNAQVWGSIPHFG